MENIFEVIIRLIAFVFLLVFVLTITCTIVVWCYQFIAHLIEFILYNLLGKNIFRYFEFFQSKITLSEESILISHFPYYQNLPSNLRYVFKSRLKKFMNNKIFETRNGLNLTEEMRVLISASAIQLTFGLKKYQLSDFEKIIIYPEPYYSMITKKYHKGEANALGIIVLSWEDFQEGYVKNADNLNLGLHEFAHALFISFNSNITDDISFISHYDEWREIGDKEFFNLRNGKQNYLRSYGGTNMMEFFSVCVEHFFETPKEFNEKIPYLYNKLVELLGQDPIRWTKK